MYNTKKIAVVINGVAMQMAGATDPSVAKSGDYSEVKTGINGHNHTRAINGVYDTVTLTLKYDSPNVGQLADLAKTHQEFAFTYKDANTGEVINSTRATCRNVGDVSADADRTFTIDCL